MATIMRGAPVAARICDALVPRVKALRERGIVPTLSVMRVGERPGDLSYERAARKRLEGLGMCIRTVALPLDCPECDLLKAIDEAAADQAVHGCLLMRPVPRGVDDRVVCERIPAAKDVDGVTSVSLAGVFSARDEGFAPCTAQAILELLDFHGIALSGARVCVVGRSLVIGRPVAMLLQARDATVTLCHSRTRDVAAACREADVVVCAMGRPRALGADAFRAGQAVVDVGTSWDERAGRLVGDADFDAVEPLVGAITPVPGGVGAVTTSVLASHVVQACERSLDPR